MMNKYSPNYNLKKIDIIIFKIHKYINIKFIYLFIYSFNGYNIKLYCNIISKIPCTIRISLPALKVIIPLPLIFKFIIIIKNII